MYNIVYLIYVRLFCRIDADNQPGAEEEKEGLLSASAMERGASALHSTDVIRDRAYFDADDNGGHSTDNEHEHEH